MFTLHVHLIISVTVVIIIEEPIRLSEDRWQKDGADKKSSF